MSPILETEYFKWLYSRTGNVDETSSLRTYWNLFQYLHDTEFVWLISNDDNRVEDGKELRYRFLEDIRVSEDDVDQRWLLAGCSVLEMLIGLAIRIQFDAEFSEKKWFWEMLSNINLTAYFDRRYISEEVETIVHDLIWRRYAPDGSGGLFPLRYPQHDQTRIELWYQCQAYLQERY